VTTILGDCIDKAGASVVHNVNFANELVVIPLFEEQKPIGFAVEIYGDENYQA
jgi:hypothetical protein